MTYISDQDTDAFITEIRSGNNEAWEKVYHKFEKHIHDCCWNKLLKFYMSDADRIEIEKDLYMAGWQGFVDSLKNYDPEKGKFLTYATYYINGEISKELDLQLNSLGLTERPKPVKKKDAHEAEGVVISRISIDDERISENSLSYGLMREKQSDETETDISGNERLNRMSEIAELLPTWPPPSP